MGRKGKRKRGREGGWQETIKHTENTSPAGYQREVNEI